jgi:transposase-like protein
MIDFKGSHFEKDIILWGVRWYVAYPIGYRQLEEMMHERGVSVGSCTCSVRISLQPENQVVYHCFLRREGKRHGRPLPFL